MVRERLRPWATCMSSVSVCVKEKIGRRIIGKEKDTDWEINFKQNQLNGSGRFKKKIREWHQKDKVWWRGKASTNLEPYMYMTNSTHIWIEKPKETPEKDLMKGSHHLHTVEILFLNLYLIFPCWSAFTLKFLRPTALLYHFSLLLWLLPKLNNLLKYTFYS